MRFLLPSVVMMLLLVSSCVESERIDGSELPILSFSADSVFSQDGIATLFFSLSSPTDKEVIISLGIREEIETDIRTIPASCINIPNTVILDAGKVSTSISISLLNLPEVEDEFLVDIYIKNVINATLQKNADHVFIKSNIQADVFRYDKNKSISENIFAFISVADPDCESLISFASTIPEYKSYEYKDNYVRLYFDDEKEEVFTYEYSDLEIEGELDFRIDTLTIKHLLDSIDVSLGIPIDSIGLFEGFDQLKNNARRSMYGPRNTAGRIELTKHAVYFWAPWHEPDEKEKEFSIATKCHELLFHSGRDVRKMSDFDLYDIVIIVCHGSSDGELVIPLEQKNILENNGIKLRPGCIRRSYKDKTGKTSYYCITGYDVNKDDMLLFLPKDLSHTILWTVVCNGGKSESHLLAAAEQLNCADFFGADNKCTADGPSNLFSGFISRFATGRASKDCLTEDGKQSVEVPYTAIREDNKLVKRKYNYCRRGTKDVYYAFQAPRQVDLFEGNTSVRIIGSFPTSYYTRSSQSEISDYLLNKGIFLEQLSTHNCLFIPYSSSTILNYSEEQRDYISLLNFDVDCGHLESNEDYRVTCYLIDSDGNTKLNGGWIYFKVDDPAEAALREKLIKFFYDTDGPHWLRQDNWCTENPLQTWYGVAYEEVFHELTINLQNNGLNGKGYLEDIPELISCHFSEPELELVIDNCDNFVNSSLLGSGGDTTLDISVKGFSLRNCNHYALEYITIKSDLLEYLEFYNCKTIGSLDVHGKRIRDLNIRGCSSLSTFGASECESLQRLELNGLEALEGFGVSEAPSLSSISYSGCSNVKDITIWNTGLSALDASGFQHLVSISINENFNLGFLDLSGLKYLRIVDCSYNSLTSLSLTGCSSLGHLSCSHNQLRHLDLPTNCNLSHYMDFDCIDNLITQQIPQKWASLFWIDSLSLTGNTLYYISNYDPKYLYYSFMDESQRWCKGYTCSGVGWYGESDPESGAILMPWVMRRE
ncbi:MAG: hypothetical protein IJP49_03675 [Bacteroidales bacterium]|nr:hypothetical protein [Bacteroidales bacterium]